MVQCKRGVVIDPSTGPVEDISTSNSVTRNSHNSLSWDPSFMSLLSARFSRALAKGRAKPCLPDTREALLFSLLKKRAAAHNVGATELEAMLRTQILWSLPTIEPLTLDGQELDVAA
jgi:hypothetical protein